MAFSFFSVLTTSLVVEVVDFGGSTREDSRPETLEPLPLTADKNYPQEDVHYFKKISNVRTDKFSLGTMLDGSKVKIPTLVSVRPLYTSPSPRDRQ